MSISLPRSCSSTQIERLSSNPKKRSQNFLISHDFLYLYASFIYTFDFPLQTLRHPYCLEINEMEQDRLDDWFVPFLSIDHGGSSLNSSHSSSTGVSPTSAHCKLPSQPQSPAVQYRPAQVIKAILSSPR